MNKEYIFNLLKLIADVVGSTIGSDCEITIHNLETREIKYIVNSHVTGREKGHVMPEKIYGFFIDSASKNKNLYNYPSISRVKNRSIKSSTIVIPDENGIPFATFCINLDIENFARLQDTLNNILQTVPINNDIINPSGAMTVQDYSSRIMGEVIQKLSKPIQLDTKESKLKVLKALDEQGVFLVRDAAAEVCDVLKISQATLYNYLREIRE
jgi:predicted transcriptional regulator YheO